MQYIYYDLEMLCDNKRITQEEMRIIAIGAVKCDQDFNIIDTYYSLVKPLGDTKVSKYCTELTGIIQEEVDSAKKFPLVYQEFKKWGNDFVDTTFIVFGLEDIKTMIKDLNENEIMHEENIFLNHINIQENINKEIAIQGSISLTNAIKLYGSDFVGTKHNPMYDALNTHKLHILYMKNKYKTISLYLKKITKEQGVKVQQRLNEIYNILNKANEFHLKNKTDNVEYLWKTFNVKSRECQPYIVEYFSEEIEDTLYNENNKLKEDAELIYKKLKRIKKKYEVFIQNKSILDKPILLTNTNELKSGIRNLNFLLKTLEEIIEFNEQRKYKIKENFNILKPYETIIEYDRKWHMRK